MKEYKRNFIVFYTARHYHETINGSCIMQFASYSKASVFINQKLAQRDICRLCEEQGYKATNIMITNFIEITDIEMKTWIEDFENDKKD